MEIKFGGDCEFNIMIHDRERPNSIDFWDGNWLTSEAVFYSPTSKRRRGIK